MKKTKKLTTLSLLIASAMILSYVESMIPAFVAVPGVKVGLANIATLFALYALDIPSAASVSIVRVFLSALLFGNAATLIYSLSGAVLSLLFMISVKKLGIFSEGGVSVIGAVSHNAGQIIAAAFMMKNGGIAAYFVPLIISGTIAGIVVGAASALLLKRISKYI